MGKTFLTAIAVLAATSARAESLADWSQTSPDGGAVFLAMVDDARDAGIVGEVAKSDAELSRDGGTAAGSAAGKVVEPAEATLLRSLHSSNLAAIQEGRLATEQSHSARVKKFAKSLVRESTRADADVMKAANHASVTLGAALAAANEADLRELRSAGNDFDRIFARIASSQRAQTVSDIEAEKDNLTDSLVKQIAERMLPKARQEETEARQLKGDVAKAQ